jgi:hypothetical protein
MTGALAHGVESSDLIKYFEIVEATEQLLASQEGLCSIQYAGA